MAESCCASAVRYCKGGEQLVVFVLGQPACRPPVQVQCTTEQPCDLSQSSRCRTRPCRCGAHECTEGGGDRCALLLYRACCAARSCCAAIPNALDCPNRVDMLAEQLDAVYRGSSDSGSRTTPVSTRRVLATPGSVIARCDLVCALARCCSVSACSAGV
jgi:hypothetical protein